VLFAVFSGQKRDFLLHFTILCIIINVKNDA